MNVIVMHLLTAVVTVTVNSTVLADPSTGARKSKSPLTAPFSRTGTVYANVQNRQEKYAEKF